MAIAAQNKDLQVEISNKQIFKIALPVSFAILVPQVNFITNNIFLGHYNSESLAVAGLTGVYYLVFSAIGYGLNNGMQALIARRAGENRPEEIGKIFNQGILISLIIAFAGILLTWLVTPHIFRYFITDPERLQQAIDFVKIRIWGLPFLYVYQMRNALLVGTNQSKYLVTGTIAEAGTNILLDYLLIFGKAGLPQMGFNGAAIASIIAEFTGMFVIFLVIRQKGITKRFHLFKNFRWDRTNSSLILSMSAPLIFQHGISIMSWEYFFLLVDSHGPIALSVSNVMRNVFGLFGVVTWAIAATTNAMVSNLMGQQKQDHVWELLGKIIKISATFSIVVALLINIFPTVLLSIYGQSHEFIEQGVPVLRVVSVAMVMMSFATVFLNAVVGSGNTRITLMIEAFTLVFYCLYAWIVLDKLFLSITWGWMCEWLYWIFMFVPSFLYIKSGKWKGKEI